MSYLFDDFTLQTQVVPIMIASLCNVLLLTSHFYIVKLGFKSDNICFLLFFLL